MRANPARALRALVTANPDIDRMEAAAQLRALVAANAFTPHLPEQRLRRLVARGFSGP